MGILQSKVASDDSSPAKKSEAEDHHNQSEEDHCVPDIDEKLYATHLRVLGHDAMVRLAQSDVLISGMGGLGVEIAKNVILSGVRSVTIHDEEACTGLDLSSQFFLAEETLGVNRARASLYSLAELNDKVEVKAHTERLTESYLKTFDAVLLTETPLHAQRAIGAITHKNRVPLIVADTKGLAGLLGGPDGKYGRPRAAYGVVGTMC